MGILVHHVSAKNHFWHKGKKNRLITILLKALTEQVCFQASFAAGESGD